MSDELERPGRHGFVDWPWPRFFGLVLVLAVAGGLLLRWAVEDSGALRALLGAGLATYATWMTSEYVDERWWEDPASPQPGSPTRAVWRTAIVTCLVAAVIALALAEIVGSPEIAFGGLMLLAVGAGPAVAWIRGGGAEPIDRPDRWILGGLAVGTVGVIALAVGAPFWPSVATVAAGLLAYGRALDDHCRRDPSLPTIPLVRLFPGQCRTEPVVAGLIGLTLLAAGMITQIALASTIGIWIVLVSLMATGAVPVRLRLGNVAELATLVVGVLLVLFAGWFTWTTGVTGGSRALLVFLVLGVALAGGTLVWRLEVPFVAVVVGFMFVWGLAPFTVNDVRSVSGDPGDAAATIVAFGDSYISGEGATEFFEGTDQRGDDANECRRAPTAYPALIAAADDPEFALDALGSTELDFLACSGARLEHIIDVGPRPDAAQEDRRQSLACNPPDDRLFAQFPCGPEQVYGNRLQLDHVPEDRSATRLVILSIGGNDARFGEVVKGCLLPGSCAERREIWLDRVGALGVELQAGYEQIRRAFNPEGANEVPVVVMPYPSVMTDTSCAASPFASTEHEFVAEFTTVLNQQIKAAAGRAGVHFFEDGIFSLEGHRVCEGTEPAINLVALQPTDGPLGERLDPGAWTHNSMHPNALGHRLIAANLAGWIDEQEFLERTAANPVADPDATSEILDLRPARPISIGPDTVDDLQTAETDDADCDLDAIGTFATRIEVFDEAGDDPDGPAPRVPIVGADPQGPICSTDSAGRWRSATVIEVPATDAEPVPVDVEADAPSIITVEADGEIFIQGGRPGDDCEAGENSEFCDFQWVLSTQPPADGDDPAEPIWQLRAISYCTTDPDCPDTIDDWTAEQLAEARRQVLPPLGVVFVGGWLVALGLAVNRDRITGRFTAVATRARRVTP